MFPIKNTLDSISQSCFSFGNNNIFLLENLIQLKWAIYLLQQNAVFNNCSCPTFETMKSRKYILKYFTSCKIQYIFSKILRSLSELLQNYHWKSITSKLFASLIILILQSISTNRDLYPNIIEIIIWTNWKQTRTGINR